MQKPYQLFKLRPLLFPITTLDSCLDTMFRMVLQNEFFNAQNCRSDCSSLGKNIHAISVSFNHAGDTTNLMT